MPSDMPMDRTISTEELMAAVTTFARFLRADPDKVVTAFPVWEDGMRGIVIVHDPDTEGGQAKVRRFLTELVKEYE